MAKRRKLIAPSADDLSRLEDEFRRETSSRAFTAAPIAQVAAETASSYDPRPAEDRERAARDRNDAESFRQKTEAGLVMLEIPLAEIDADALVRDRVVLDAEDMQELQMSIAANGLRLPVEVYPLAEDGRGFRYGLLSGYRRLRAVQALQELTDKPQYATIRAVLRDPEAMGGTFAAMIEENEIRANLSHFERGRIAVIASQQGAFINVEAAVDALFPMASKGKRSKIRSFALIFEELGDMLRFPEMMKERDGLKLAAALRGGAEARLRDLLAQREPESAADEAEMVQEALAQLEPVEADPARGGRPKKPTPRAEKAREVRKLTSGVTLRSVPEQSGWSIRIEGGPVDGEMVDALLAKLAYWLESPQ
ncbi:ParB/RepB/Spo0J family partition protein [Thioclava sp. GXIMD4215]|uniref:ParB/RepB/Spo0J family partition protein n=1 Tax=Thioclava sp. GXIMD4215 TaxID=3131928 RepID=UPI00311B25B7